MQHPTPLAGAVRDAGSADSGRQPVRARGQARRTSALQYKPHLLHTLYSGMGTGLLGLGSVLLMAAAGGAGGMAQLCGSAG